MGALEVGMKPRTHLASGRAPLGTRLGRHLVSRLAFLALAALVWVEVAGAGEGAPAAGQAATGVEVIGQVTLSLMLVVAVLLVLAWAMRRLNRFQPQGASSLRVLGGLSLGARERILLVGVGDKRLLVGVSPGGLRTLLVLDEGTRQEATPPPETSFSVRRLP